MQTNPASMAAAAMALIEPDPPRRARRGHGRATLDDVAAVAEVTKITVSRYLREPARVAPATAERVRAALAATGYLPNKQAGLLASGRSNIVAALIPNLGHSIFGETVQALSEALQATGHELLLASTGYSPEREEEQLRTLLGWAPSALVVTGRHHTPGALRLLAEARAAGTPVVEIWDHHPPELTPTQVSMAALMAAPMPFAQIGFDHGAVGQAMAAHLLDAGHQRLAYLDSGLDTDFRAHERGAAFAAEAQRRGAQVRLLRAAVGDPFDAGRQAFDDLGLGGRSRSVAAAVNANANANANAHFPATAIACANDHLACGVLMQALDAGVQVPSALAVLGFGDFPVGRQLRPALSTVRPPSQQIGRETALALARALASDEAPVGRALPWQLLVRGSTAGPA
jgi:LacI family gluconate utilization system Gnt-I transcriptional repressor